MSEQDKGKVVKFPTKDSQNSKSLSLGEAFLTVVKSLDEAPRKQRTSTRISKATQTIKGDNNAQVKRGMAVEYQKIEGNNNTQIAGDVQNLTISTPRQAKVVRGPAIGSIGAQGLLKEQIQEAFGKLGQERARRIENGNVYAAMYSKFKRDFSIPKAHSWTIIWDWPESRASEILDYLQEKYNNTITGRIIKASIRKALHQLPRKQLFAKETLLLTQLGLKSGSPEVKAEMQRLLGTSTHKEMDARQHANWVAYLEQQVDKIYEACDE